MRQENARALEEIKSKFLFISRLVIIIAFTLKDRTDRSLEFYLQ